MGTAMPIPSIGNDKKDFRNWLYKALSEGHKKDVDTFIDNIWESAQKENTAKSWASNNTLKQVKKDGDVEWKEKYRDSVQFEKYSISYYNITAKGYPLIRKIERRSYDKPNHVRTEFRVFEVGERFVIFKTLNDAKAYAEAHPLTKNRLIKES